MREIMIDGIKYKLVPVDNPVSLKINKNIEVYPEDPLYKMTWEEAVEYCNSLGNRWRLPDRQELLAMYEARDIIGGFDDFSYWSSSEYNNNDAWRQNFNNGNQYSSYKYANYRVRAVRDVE